MSALLEGARPTDFAAFATADAISKPMLNEDNFAARASSNWEA